ncbi:hypothetical protein CK203_116481 [Vitis vinifera]|uniref:Uncharacterized protein n=1 Tax=Vitis vinifera TaxID=29760 RepID=A0A438DGR8_VITVI|nr:hypothetical protein CK203_116481 [Vitis vinifera]
MKTPMSSSIKLDKDEKGKSIDSTMYRGMIESHLSAVKRIVRYLKGIMDVGLWERITRRENAQKGEKSNTLTVDQAGFGFGTQDFGFGMDSSSLTPITAGFNSFLAYLGFQGKRPAEPSQLTQMEAHRKARFDTTLFSTVEDYQRYKQKFTKRKSGSKEKYQFLPTASFRI